MRRNLQLWLALANSLCSLVTLSSVQAQTAPNGFLRVQGVINQLPPAGRSPVSSNVRTRKSIPAWFEFSERWMFVDISTLLAPTCSGSLGQNESQFIISGRGGLPPNPREALALEQPLEDLGLPMPRHENRALTTISTDSAQERVPIQTVEAQGWVIGENGEVVLTATPATATPHVPWLTAADCHTFKGAS